MSRIYTSATDGGSYVNAISRVNGLDVDGHVYQVVNGSRSVELRFQQGPVLEVGVNGMQNEQLIAVLIHRLKFLNESFSCRENVIAIVKLEEALHWLEARTRDRQARGVEGKSEP